MSVNSLHVTNGDSVIYTWKKAGLLGTHLAWKDVLHEGPVPAGMALEDLSRIRADYLASRGNGNAIRLHREFEKRDALIRRAADFEEVVLWFEHDLYDQLHLLQIVSVLREQGMTAGSVQLVQSDQYLGMLNADELLALLPRRRFITNAIADAAARAWAAFTDSDPQALADAANQNYTGLPFMRDALRRLCEEYPDSASGLSRTQKQLLESCAQGARRREEIFKKAQSREEAMFLGDVSAYAAIDDLCSEPAPLLVYRDPEYDVTVLGRRVLAGDTDWLEHRPLDRWVGGVHLHGAGAWRWNDSQQTLVERVPGGEAAQP